jgi:hypothetical protein
LRKLPKKKKPHMVEAVVVVVDVNVHLPVAMDARPFAEELGGSRSRCRCATATRGP